MLQTLPVSSNSEVIIMFPGRFDINPLLKDKSMFSWQKKLLRLKSRQQEVKIEIVKEKKTSEL